MRGVVNLRGRILKITPRVHAKTERKAMSYYIQCGCGKKLTKKPIKTLRCPRCGSVYKKPKKFILAVYICLLLFFVLAFAFIPDKMGLLASVGSGIGAYIMFLWIVDTLNFDLLDAVILVAGFLIFGGL